VKAHPEGLFEGEGVSTSLHLPQDVGVVEHPVAGVDYPQRWAEFEAWFPDEEHCVAYLVHLRWPDGFRCPRCGGERAWPTTRGRLVCAACRHQISVTAGTILAGTRTPLRVWFAAAWHLTQQKLGVSALGLQRVLGWGSYQTAWTILHKLRRAMVRLERAPLLGPVEVDETYVGGIERGRRGRLAGAKAIVAIAVEVPEPDRLGRVRLTRIADFSAESLLPFVGWAVTPGALVRTDGWQGYRPLAAAGYVHERVSLRASGDAAHVAMPGVHRVASLLERWILGTHHGSVGHDHLDAYLEEFTFRFNRRRARYRGLLFYRLLEQMVRTSPAPYRAIVESRSTPDHNMLG